MNLFQIVYSSRPFGFDSSIINGILINARHCNQRDDITGALLCRQDVFLQYLEGPETAVRGAIARISRDDRHVEVEVHIAEPTQARLFPSWEMYHDPATTWMWSPKEVADGAIKRADKQVLLDIFRQISARIP